MKSCKLILIAAVLLLPLALPAADDDKLVAIEREPAEYPKKALRKCIEGHVVVRFIVATDGTTKDIAVISSRPLGVFEKAALAAVEKWRFEPRVINGVPVQREETQRLVFEPGCTS
ncbi:MAG: energy transducer TonB [Gammaproteobacteria bacterium]|nr:energy transducer TonB [Gammaproteobacteria bacterium]NND61496.1 energy transducer TonB [Gammaproteobacteria bacterium]